MAKTKSFVAEARGIEEDISRAMPARESRPLERQETIARGPIKPDELRRRPLQPGSPRPAVVHAARHGQRTRNISLPSATARRSR